MNIFAAAVLLLARKKLASGSQVRSALRWMRQYQSAHSTGDVYVLIPKKVKRSTALLALTSVYRLAIHEPAVFAMGMVCIPLAAAYGCWALLSMAWKSMGA